MMIKPRFRIQWDYSVLEESKGQVIGFWLWTCNVEAIKLQPSKYYSMKYL